MQVDWRDWSETTLRHAEEAERPILLSLRTCWSAAARRMDAACFADPGVAAAVERDYVAVRVDADRRPDLNRRFNMGGLPTTAFLTCRGELLAGSPGYLSPERMRPLLERMAWVFRSDADSVQRAVDEHRKRELQLTAGTADVEDLSLTICDDVVAAARSSFDTVHGAFGRVPRRPQPVLLHLLADEVFWRRDGALGAMLAAALGAMSLSPLWDETAYGFFHTAAQADWREPSGEKLLEDNALLLEAFIAAWRVLLDPSFRLTAEGIIDYLDSRLAAPEGGFYASQDEDGAIDPTLYIDRSAIGAHAYLAAWVHFGREYRDFALRTLERLWGEAWLAGRGFVHYLGQPSSGADVPPTLLADQSWPLLAFCEAAQQTGEWVWIERARAIAETMRDRFWDEAAGALRDAAAWTGAAAGHFGTVAGVQRPLDDNSVAAEGLLTLAVLTGEDWLAPLVRRSLTAGYDVYAQATHLAAPYARAVSKFVRSPLLIELRAVPGSDVAESFVRGAYVRYHPWRVVRWRPGGEGPSALASWGEQAAPEVRSADQLDALIGSLRPT